MTQTSQATRVAREVGVSTHAAASLHRRVLELDSARQRHSLPRQLYASFLRVTGPARSIVRGVAAARRWGSLAAQHGGADTSTQAREIASLVRRCGMAPEECYRYRLFASPQRERAELFVPLLVNMGLRNSVYARLGIDSGRLGDKRRFARICAETGLPTAATSVAFDHGIVTWPGVEELPAQDLFEKRADRLCGEGAARWTHLGEHADGTGRSARSRSYRLDDGPDAGVVLDHDSLVARLAESSRRGALIVQARLTNHAGVAALSTGGLCTVRVVTHRSRDGDPQHLLSVFRMPTGGMPADNFAAGGLAATVDPDTGIVGRAVRKSLADAITGTTIERHPDTGAAIAGHRLPLWPESIALCLRAHEVFREFPSVGWDVALTPAGPALLEGNYNWDVVLAQQPGLRPLGETPWLASFLSFMDG